MPKHIAVGLVVLTMSPTLLACSVLSGDDGGSATPARTRVDAIPEPSPSVTAPLIGSSTPATTSAVVEQRPSSTPAEVSTPIAPPVTLMPEPTPTPLPPTTVSGSGDGYSAPVRFPTGLAVVTVNHSGAQGIKVRMQDTAGTYDRRLMEGRGGWLGSLGISVQEPGDYVFAVEADGDWWIEVSWPTPETAAVSELPFSLSGTGVQAIYFLRVPSGDHTISGTHDGTGTFSVDVLTSDGRRYNDPLVGSGVFSGSMQFSVRGKAFEFVLLDVRADGNWTIDLQ